MKKVSVRKFTVLGMVLMAASAVTAAVLPGRSNDLKQDNSADNATLRSQSGLGNDVNQNIVSCVADNTQNWSCHLSLAATLTNGNGSNNAGNVTVGNTSQSTSATGHEGDTTSVHQ
ncbi:hypothetical protein D3H65_15000 [Paraflavitalea soli]|uniref:Uncharacterized protein n=1 Tax=Paraflavitalea soli TaxID=2315862 RepID=A0A3B7MQ86_9BACT|nr:hypothetical protein [Paraflavitalea soli]AXY75210.1 hypothetical protein D3H65_15000 [Paraflavitalea soli]